MSREFYQDGWGRRKNKYKQDNYPCQNQVDVEVDEDYSRHDYSYDHDMKKTIDQKAPSIVEGSNLNAVHLMLMGLIQIAIQVIPLQM